jgi:hypothetical protein
MEKFHKSLSILTFLSPLLLLIINIRINQKLEVNWELGINALTTVYK